MNTLSKSSRRWLRQAAEWRLLGRLLERPHGDWESEIAALAREVKASDLRAAAAGAAGAAASFYLAKLGPGGAVSPREVTYRSRQDPGAILADIAAFHHAFAFTPNAEDPLDHVAVEASFVGFLCLKAAFAAATSNSEAERTVREAVERFTAEHLRPCAEPLAARLGDADAGYLAVAARALQARCGRISEHEGSRPHSIPIAIAGGANFECGACDF
jgi:TorA maturation chaperone TorD